MVSIRYAHIDDAVDIARVWVESWRSAYRGIVPDSFLDAIDVGEWAGRQRRIMEQPLEGWITFVAELDTQIAGWAWGGPNRDAYPDYAAELYTLYIMPGYQRQGIGFQLTLATGRWLVREGLTSMIVWVLRENHSARQFYEAIGGRYCQERQIDIAGVSLPEVSYGWTDLSILLDLQTDPSSYGC